MIRKTIHIFDFINNKYKMANSAHPAKAGFNQSGAYFIVLQDLEPTPGTAAYAFTITTPSTGSGGATTEPVLTATTMGNILRAGVTYPALTDTEAAEFVRQGKLLRDMGKTIIVGRRTYRKFQIVTGSPDSRGLVGNPGPTNNAGYGSFYLDVGREGVTGGPAPIARYF